MRAEKLHTVAFNVSREAQAFGIVALLQELETLLKRVVAPDLPSVPSANLTNEERAKLKRETGQQADARAEFNHVLGKLYSKLDQAPSNLLTPSEVRILRQIGVLPYTGSRLRARVQESLQGDALEPDQIRRQFSKVIGNASQAFDRVDRLVETLAASNVPRDSLEVHAATFSAIFPFELGSVTLEQIAEELQELDFHLRPFYELAGETPPGSIPVSTISSDSIDADIIMVLGVGYYIAKAIDWIVTLAGKMMDLRVKHRDFEEAGIYQELTEARLKEIVDTKLGEFRDDLLEQFPGPEERRNELETYLHRSLQYLADRIDHGARFEVRVLPPAPSASEEEVRPDIPDFTSFQDMRESGAAMAELELGEERVLFVGPPDLLEAGDQPEPPQGDTEEDEQVEGGRGA